MEAWDLPDPAGKSLEEVREIRDLIEERVRDLVIDRLDAIQSNPTAHHLRLMRLLRSLVSEFGNRRSEAEIRACADAVLSRYADAPVQSFRHDARPPAHQGMPAT